MLDTVRDAGPDPRAAVPDAGSDVARWNSVGGQWVAQRRQRVWRRHSDWVCSNLLRQWMRPGKGAALKTDLFDEALSDGLFEIMRARAGSVHGTDLAERTARAARSRHPEMVVRVADVRDLPYPTGAFETVVSLSTLDHFDTTGDIERSLGEIRRVTRPGGRLILSLDNPVNPKIALRARLDDGLLQWTGLVPYRCGKTLGPRAMRSAVERSGFRVIETAAILHCPRAIAVWIAGWVERFGAPGAEEAFLAALRPFEKLERLPIRYLTGHFCALLAQARD